MCRNVHLRRVEPAGVRRLHGETSQPALLQQIPGPLFGQESGEVPEYRIQTTLFIPLKEITVSTCT